RADHLAAASVAAVFRCGGRVAGVLGLAPGRGRGTGVADARLARRVSGRVGLDHPCGRLARPLPPRRGPPHQTRGGRVLAGKPHPTRRPTTGPGGAGVRRDRRLVGRTPRPTRTRPVRGAFRGRAAPAERNTAMSTATVESAGGPRRRDRRVRAALWLPGL